MSTGSPTTPSPAAAGAVPLERLLADRPPVLNVGDNLDQIRDGRRVAKVVDTLHQVAAAEQVSYVLANRSDSHLDQVDSTYVPHAKAEAARGASRVAP